MKITQKSAEKEFLKSINSSEFIYQTWLKEKFGAVKLASATEKGDLAENFVAALIRSIGHADVEMVPGRRGDYDIGVGRGRGKKRLEVKLATQDTSGNFQFNGIRHDTDYTHLFLLGVMRSTIRYRMLPKAWLTTRRGEYPLVSMARRTNAAFKLTRPEDDLLTFDRLEADLRRYLGTPK